jgi:hypothetical protein
MPGLRRLTPSLVAGQIGRAPARAIRPDERRISTASAVPATNVSIEAIKNASDQQGGA